MLFQRLLPLRRAAVALAAALGCCASAQAGYVVINADPLFSSSPLEGYGWSATGALYLPEGCIGALGDWGGTVTIPSTSTGPCGASAGLMLSDVSVRFYRASDLSTASIVTLGTYLPFLGAAAGPDPQALTSVTFSTNAEGQLDRVTGLSTSRSLTYRVSLPNLGPSTFSSLEVDFTLDFNMSSTPYEAALRAAGGPASTSDLIVGNGSALNYTVLNAYPAFEARSESTSVTASEVFADNPLAVPTPGTLTLALLAGVAAWSERRRLPRLAR